VPRAPTAARPPHWPSIAPSSPYDRQGRGESGDRLPYSPDREEVEDLLAVIGAAGVSARLHGISSGGALALELAERFPEKVRSLARYEIPYVVDDSRRPVGAALEGRLRGMVTAGRRGAPVRQFMREVVCLPHELIAAMPIFPGDQGTRPSRNFRRCSC
jgi:pimeloyl-ACP methyl ester carboxylesterase